MHGPKPLIFSFIGVLEVFLYRPLQVQACLLCLWFLGGVRNSFLVHPWCYLTSIPSALSYLDFLLVALLCIFCAFLSMDVQETIVRIYRCPEGVCRCFRWSQTIHLKYKHSNVKVGGSWSRLLSLAVVGQWWLRLPYSDTEKVEVMTMLPVNWVGPRWC